MKHKKIIAFDFDGTIADTTDLEKIAMVRTIRLFGNEEITLDNIESHYGPTEPGIVRALVPPSCQNEATEKFFEIYQEVQKETLSDTVTGMKKLLKDLKKEKNIHIVEVTGRSMETLKITLAYLGIEDCFERLYAGSDNGINKGESLNQVMKDYGVEREDIVYIGDTTADCHTMEKAGFDLISVSYCHDKDYRAELERLNPGNVVDDTAQLRESLYRLF